MATQLSKERIAVTCGDPAGIGPEIIFRWARRHGCPDAAITVVGPKRWLDTLREENFPFSFCEVGPEDFRAVPGKPTDEGAGVALAAMEEAARGCVDGRFDAVVTGPVSKSGLQRIGYPFPGQSEFFANRWKGIPVMAFTGGRLRVVLATWHIPFREVPGCLTKEAITRAVEQAAWLARADCHVDKPRIGVCGLNPHAGEEGVLGMEEKEYLNPILTELQKEIPGVSLCQPGDTVFARALRGEFDSTVALYHDQGLAAVKTIDFDSAVNVTLGLPYIRTSPDHGTAFSLAGKGMASVTSFAHAVNAAIRLVRYHRKYPSGAVVPGL